MASELSGISLGRVAASCLSDYVVAMTIRLIQAPHSPVTDDERAAFDALATMFDGLAAGTALPDARIGALAREWYDANREVSRIEAVVSPSFERLVDSLEATPLPPGDGRETATTR